MTNSSFRCTENCKWRDEVADGPHCGPCIQAVWGAQNDAEVGPGFQLDPDTVRPGENANGGPTLPRDVHLPEGPARNELPMAEGLLDYFPNALAEVAKLSFKATKQHHPEAGMHWDRGKSTDHANKIVRHTIDRGKLDEHGERHSAMLAWRALANLQDELERDLGLPPSRASRNRPF